MSREIVTIVNCDLHQSKGERVPGRQFDFASRIDGEGSFRFLTVDLCDDCSKSLRDVVDELVEVGRDFEGKLPTSAKPRGPKPRTTPTVCPVCGHDSPTRSALGHHLKRMHGSSISQAFPDETYRVQQPTPCPDCDFVAKDGTGLASHRRAAHPDAADE